MREMKDSGVEWIGNIPFNWHISSLNNLCDDFIVPMRDKPQFGGDIPWCRIEDIDGYYLNGTKSEQYVSKQTVDEMNLKVYPTGTVVSSCSATIGVSAITTLPLCTNQTFIGLVPGKELDSKFLLFTMTAIGDYMKFVGHGSTISYISQDKYRKIKIALPSIDRQKYIATALMKKCCEIDSIISKQETIIEKLKEYKYSIIYEAVTKGLNNNVQMKNSGIPWLGEIPQDWNIYKVKNIAKRKSDKNMPDEQVLSLYRELGIVIKSERDDNHNVTSENTENYKFVEENDLVVNKMKAWQGSIAISAYRGIVSPAYYVYRITDKNVYPWYVHYTLRCKAYLPEYRRLSGGIRLGQWDLSDENFKNIPLPIPASIEEQKCIANYLDNRVKRIDKDISIRQDMIQKMHEYKKSLIYEVITGKKEI